ncbi:UNVERIFIED_CONTAM: putative pentatricopeptide repeat-containing protein [Sesamum radiatum]|uniref:Pentatricopeptide repeat-containing protein n=1 Tax=Sesamum radiatum TaxID=300843 RepID=A0AAW2JF68_SESRA
MMKFPVIETVVICHIFDGKGEVAASVASVAAIITFTSPNEDELVAMANALSLGDKFLPIQRDCGSVKFSVDSLFRALKPTIWVLLEKVVRLTGAGDCLVGGAVASICAGLDIMQSLAVDIASVKGAVETETNVPAEYELTKISVHSSAAINLYLGLSHYPECLRRSVHWLRDTPPKVMKEKLHHVLEIIKSEGLQMKSLKEGLKFQAHAVKSGFLPTVVATNQLISLYSKHGLIHEAHKLFDGMPERNVFSWNTIINAYIKSRSFTRAKSLFYSSPSRDTVTYNSMISGYARSDGYESEAIELFIQMQFDNDTSRIDEFTLATMLNLVAKLKVLCYGKQVHSFMVKSGNDLSGFALSSLIDMYSKCGSFWDACRVVNGCGSEDLVDLVVKNALIAACCRQGELEMARDILLSNEELIDEVSLNIMISGYVQNGLEEEAVEFFKHMAEEGFRWNEHTFGSLLTAWAALRSLKLGKEVHAWVLKEGTCFNPFIGSGLVDVYCKCGNMRYANRVHETVAAGNVFAITSLIVGYSAKGDMSEARRLFDSSPQKTIFMWTAIISGYVKLQQCEDAFVLFREYAAQEATIPDSVILRLFRRVSTRDTIIYNVMIASCAHHGYEDEAIHLFEEMIGQGLQPDGVTFITLLSACRHGGLVEAGTFIYGKSGNDLRGFALSTLIDMYSKCGSFWDACRVVNGCGSEDLVDLVVKNALIAACCRQGELEMAREILLSKSQGLSSVEIFCRITNHSTKLFLGILNGPKSSEDQVISGPGGAKHSISISSRHRATRGFPPNAILPVADGRK